MRPTNSPLPRDVSPVLPGTLRIPSFGWRISGWLASLRGRLLIMVAAALAPAAALAVVQADLSYQRERAGIFEQLSQTARSAASDHEAIFLGAEKILSVLTNQSKLFADHQVCQAALRTALMGLREYSNIIRVDANGNVLCSAIPLDEPINFAAADWFQSLKISSASVVMSKPLPGPIAKAPVVFLAQPLLGPDGGFAGGTAVTLMLSALEQLPRQTGVPAGAFVRLVDRDGMPIVGAGEHFVPSAIVKEAIRNQFQRFSWTEPSGNIMIYALVPILKGEINVLIGAEQANLLNWTRLDLISRLVMPLLMVMTALVIVWIGANYLVLRWVGYMRRLARAYAAGSFTRDLSTVSRAPSEFRELAHTFSDMASNIESREQDLKRAIEQSDVLRKEVHHRVKNNLQIVIGLLNIYQGATAQSAADVLDRARSRVHAFAHIHQHLYETEDLGRVHLGRFVRDLCAFAHQAYGGEDQKIVLVVDAPDLVLSADTTISLALFLLEAQTNVYFYAFPDKTGGRLTISVTQAPDGDIIARVTDDGCGQRPSDGDYAVAQSLMRGFARQLGGTFETGHQPGRGTYLSLEFTPRGHESAVLVN